MDDEDLSDYFAYLFKEKYVLKFNSILCCEKKRGSNREQLHLLSQNKKRETTEMGVSDHGLFSININGRM